MALAVSGLFLPSTTFFCSLNEGKIDGTVLLASTLIPLVPTIRTVATATIVQISYLSGVLLGKTTNSLSWKDVKTIETFQWFGLGLAPSVLQWLNIPPQFHLD